MKLVTLFLFLSLGMWADSKLDISNLNNKNFYKQVAYVFVQPLYQPINTAQFEDMNGTEMSQKMRQSIEEFLPIYLSTESPLYKHNDNYPTTEIRRFFKVLNKYMDILKFEKRDAEIYEILDKQLSDAHDCIQNASSLLDLLFGMYYYENILHFQKCDNSQLCSLLQKNKLPKEEYFFDVLEEERKKNVNIMLEAITETGVSQKTLEIFSKKLMIYTQKYYKKYSKKLEVIVINDSYEALEEYENYMNAEFESLRNVKSVTKIIFSKLLLKIQKLVSVDEKDYGYFIEHKVQISTLLVFMGLGDTYKTYKEFLKNYNECLKSCP